MSDQFGTITGIDRTNGLVGAILEDGDEHPLPNGLPYSGEAPAPLARARFVEYAPSKYYCEGSMQPRDVRLHDDFLYVATPSLTEYDGDTAWVLRGSGGTRTQDAVTLADNGVGVVRYVTNATTNNFVAESKSTDALYPPTAPGALWWSGRLAVNSTASIASHWGLADTDDWAITLGNVNMVAVGLDSTVGTNWLLITADNAAAATALDTGVAVVVDTWTVFDIIWTPDEWAALWIDGSGPYVQNGATIPAATNLMQPGMTCLTRANAAKRLYCDWVHVEQIANVLLDPAELAAAAA